MNYFIEKILNYETSGLAKEVSPEFSRTQQILINFFVGLLFLITVMMFVLA